MLSRSPHLRKSPSLRGGASPRTFLFPVSHCVYKPAQEKNKSIASFFQIASGKGRELFSVGSTARATGNESQMFTLPVLARESSVQGKTCDCATPRPAAGRAGRGVQSEADHTLRPGHVDHLRVEGGGLSQELFSPQGAGQVCAHGPPSAHHPEILPACAPHPSQSPWLNQTRCQRD